MRNCLALALTMFAACKQPTSGARAEIDAGMSDALAPDGSIGDAGDAAIDGMPDASVDAAIVDETAPSLVDITPASGTPTWLHAPIRLTFDEDLAAASATVTVTLDGAPLAATVTFEAPRTLAITLDPAARGIGALAVHVAPTVLDLAGNVQSAPVDLSLPLAAWSDIPVDRGRAITTPSYVVDARGTMTAAWLVSTLAGGRAVVAELVGTTWRDLGDSLGDDATSVSVALDEAGAPLVAWADDGHVHVARWSGSAWTELASPGDATAVKIVTPPGGHPIVALFGSTVAVRELVDESWQPLGSDLTLAAAIVGDPALASPASGTAVVGWVDATATLVTYRVDTASTALAPIAVSPGSRLSLAARGSTVAVAYDTWAGSYGVLAATTTGTAWSQLGKPLDIDIAGDARGPAIAFDAGGAPIVAWTELVETAQRGAIARWSGSAWTIIGGTTWLGSTTAAPGSAALALAPGGAPIVATVSAGTVRIARFNGPRTAPVGIAARAALTGCSFDAAAPPAMLSQTGCFDLATAKRPVAHPGLVPYDVVAELWSDGAKKRRWIALPADVTMTLGSNGAWAAPVGSFMVKEFALETTPGNPATRRPVETRFLVGTDSGWVGFSYRWNAAGTDATLLADTAYDIAWTLDDGTQHIHVYPSRAHCRSCHYAPSGPLLGVRPEQLARWADYGGVIADQPATLAALGIVTPVTPPAFTAPHDPSASVERRMRGYMAANCSHCHNPQYLAIKDLRFATPLASTKLCEAITPGSPAESLVYQKVTSRPGMPPLGTAAVDPLARDLLGAWITGMTSCP